MNSNKANSSPLIGKRVESEEHGDGIVINQDGHRLLVAFDYGRKHMEFHFPACFRAQLSLLDLKASKEIKKLLDNEGQSAFILHNEAPEPQEVERRDSGSLLVNPLGKAKKEITAAITNQYDRMDEFCEEYAHALVIEAEKTRRNERDRRTLTDGERIAAKNGQYLYIFESETELFLPSGTPIKIWWNNEENTGIIVSCEEYNVVIDSSIHLGNKVSSIEFTAESWRLLYVLKDKIQQLAMRTAPIAEAVACEGKNKIRGDFALLRGQQAAIRLTEAQPVTFIWGPPGTGKTQTLASIALNFISKGYKVLMLSHSNIAVDGAILRTHKLDQDQKPGKLIRYGFPRNEQLLRHEYLTSFNIAINNHPELKAERKSSITLRKSLPRTSLQQKDIRARLTKIKEIISKEEEEVAQSAQLLATTVSKAVVDLIVNKRRYDVVIFDEASMALVPQIVFAASLASKHFVCLGDFRQLPPIVQSEDESILNTDIFGYCGITEAVNKGYGHDWLCMLDVQYRMHPNIANFVSAYMYGKGSAASFV
ncbi:MAG: AAA family ATPase [Clostridiaceae bacterium]|nr:AAA family ATPase [Clostridiaceae bacterium]